MYINYLERFDISKLISDKYKVYAHTGGEGKEKETILEHIQLCKKYFTVIVIEKGIMEVLSRFEEEFLGEHCRETKELFKEMLVNIINLHDIGKINPIFQKNKMGNDLSICGTEAYSNSNHSIYSAIIYIDYYIQEIVKLSKEKKINVMEKDTLIALMTINSFIISKHHGGVSDLDDYLKNYLDGDKLNYYKEIINPVYEPKLWIKEMHFKGIIKSYKNYVNKVNGKSVNKSISTYAYVRLMLSLLVASDFYATSEYMNDTKINDIGSISEIDEFYESYKTGEIYKSIRSYEINNYGKTSDFNSEKNINILRTELFLDAEKKLLKNVDKNIFYLEAPTGGGKSNVANNLSFQLIKLDDKKNKIFYVYPFNTLIDQNLKNIEKIYEGKQDILNKIAVINSLFPIKTVNNEEDIPFEEYQKALLNRQFLNYPMVLTTHVSLFRYLFGCGREDIFPFHQLINSVIVLDEIQSYKNIIWGEIIEFLQGFARLLNIKIIIMSATLPDLDKLLGTKGNSVNLIEDRAKYFNNPLFRNRVEVDYSLLEENDVMDKLINKIKLYKNKKILIEFISKRSAYEFYESLKDISEREEVDFEIRLITGDDNQVEREKIINEIGSIQNIVLVATQVIEAGVDIDMDIGFKDISIFDSEEQFLGRINRSCKKINSKVYFFNLDDGNRIYKGDVRAQDSLTLKNIEIRDVLRSKEFIKYYEKVLLKLINITSSENELNTKKFFSNEVGLLNCHKVEEKMKLIDDDGNDITVFLNTTLVINGVEFIGEQVWESYRVLLMDNEMEYAEKIVKLSEVKSRMKNFMYRIRNKRGFPYSDRIGDILYIDNGSDYFKSGKLDIEKFNSGVGEFI